MKIAVITDDGQTISQHFGRAQYYLVVTVEDGKVSDREMRPKLGHATKQAESNSQTAVTQTHSQGHGMDPASHQKHVQMAETISDCEALLCRGMGQGAYISMAQVGVKPVVTDIVRIDDAVEAYLKGTIVDHTEMLH